MQAPSSAPSSSSGDMGSDERREWIRVDDHLLLEYRLLNNPVDLPPPGLPPVTHDMIATAVGKPTSDLLARNGDLLAGSPLLPWMMKVDWLLEGMLKAMAALHPECMAIARMTDVNISGGGISFPTPCEFRVGDLLALKVILPPFTPIQTVARVIRSIPNTDAQGYTIATDFQNLAVDDQEHIIRHIIQTQAVRLRARRAGSSV